jgi:hypothetical protein
MVLSFPCDGPRLYCGTRAVLVIALAFAMDHPEPEKKGLMVALIMPG